MTTHKLKALFDFYDDYLYKQFGVERLELYNDQYDLRNIPSMALYAHLRWMCWRGTALVDTGDIENLLKAHRWLGYIQGELRGVGLFSVTQLRKHSREQNATHPREHVT